MKENNQAPMNIPTGKKYDQGKTRFDLIDYNQIEKLAKVLTSGANKYGDNNWQDLPDFDNRYFAALMRHLLAWRRGELIDPESNMPHLAHVMCNTMFLMWKEDQNEITQLPILDL